MNRVYALYAVGLLLVTCCSLLADDKPNVIFILADDK